MTPLSLLQRWLSTDDEAATITRVFTSKHVADLRVIVSVSIVGSLVLSLIGLLGSIEFQLVNHWDEVRSAKTAWSAIKQVLNGFSAFLPFLLTLLGALGVLVAWAYQSASKRLGVVDLFACEISTVCRIGTVLEAVRRIVERYEQGPASIARSTAGSHVERPFLSQENYFPVFDGSSSDLQTLEAPVVIPITGFYTYMKGLRDSMRTMAAIEPEPADFGPDASAPIGTGAWHEAARNVIYLWFLALESARHAVHDLVEFEPEQAEHTIVILLGELVAYRFLRTQYTDPRDLHTGRIQFRVDEYHRLRHQLLQQVKRGCEADEKHHRVQWAPAAILVPELKRRFDAALHAPPRSSSSATAPTAPLAGPPDASPLIAPGHGFSELQLN